MAASSFFIFLLLSAFITSTSQSNCNISNAEVAALEAISSALSRGWKFSGDPCTDNAIDENAETQDGFSCDSNCHVIELKATNLHISAQIPPQIGNLTYLQELNLQQNVLYGSLPEEIGKLQNLKNLTIKRNNLNGQLPPQIGSLTNLTGLYLGTNNFNGSIPKELGNLKKLQELDFGSSGLGGELPAELANLTNLEIWNGYGNNFNGSIPDVFTNMVKLKELRLYGNNFQGALPSSLRNLTNLQILYLGDTSSMAPIPTSLSGLKSLKGLSLQNCQLTGGIPSFLGSLQSLTYLDLSFNNLNDTIPTDLGSLSSLDTLFLGNNSLVGELPDLTNLTQLKRFDVSYNQLSGSLPRWLDNSDLQINLIWNFFNTTNASDRVASAAAFNCVPKGNCARSISGDNVGFSIECGGSAVTLGGIAYDADNETLNEVKFLKHANHKWAVSTSGYVQPNDFKPLVTDIISIANTNTGEDVLYYTARASPSTLRYYGLNMTNGNYDVTLHFAEVSIWDDTGKWYGNGRRIFDIYIQGEKKFDKYNIMDKAGGAHRAWKETFNVSVVGGVLEIHLQWAGKGTCCTPKSHTYGPLISAIHVTLPGADNASSKSKSNTKVIAITIPLVSLVIIIAGIFLWLWRRRKHLSSLKQMEDGFKEFGSMRNKPNLYTYNELRDATNGFAPTNKLGEGGFGQVYKGTLKNGIIVAVKRLSSTSPRKEFINEVAVISSVQHRNLLKLIGCCFEGDNRILVLEYMERNSLYQAFHGPMELRISLDWPTRMNICIGVARGIAYLHEESSPRIIHRDIKSNNILLDRNLNPKIADFGLAKLFKEEQTHVSTRIAGTMGYLAPEYATRGQLTEKADVYSFGILALEIVSGKDIMDRSLPPDQMYLLDHVWQLFEQGRLVDIVDKQVRYDCSEEEALRVLKVALFCTQTSLNQRPTMTQVVTVLSKPCEIDISKLQQEENDDYTATLSLLAGQESSSESGGLYSSIIMPTYRLSLLR